MFVRHVPGGIGPAQNVAMSRLSSLKPTQNAQSKVAMLRIVTNIRNHAASGIATRTAIAAPIAESMSVTADTNTDTKSLDILTHFW